jgi:hypothetical protein
MNRSNAGKWACLAVCVAAVAVFSIGCNPLNLAAFMFARDERVPAPYPLVFDKEGPKKDKEEVVVLLLPQLAPGTTREFVTADRELAEKLARALPEMAKDNKEGRKVRVISPTQVDKFKMANPDWRRLSAGEIGEKLGADFVLEIELSQMRLYQPNTGTERIYEGRAEVSVTVYEIGAGGGEFKDRYPLSFAYPTDRMVRSASAVSESEFKKSYLETLARKIALQHVDSKRGIGVTDGQ